METLNRRRILWRLIWYCTVCRCMIKRTLGLNGLRKHLKRLSLIVGVCNCSMFCCTLLYVHSSIAIILFGKRELVALLNLSSLCLVMVEWLFLSVPWGCLRFVIVVFPDHTHFLFLRTFWILDVFTTKRFIYCISNNNHV